MTRRGSTARGRQVAGLNADEGLDVDALFLVHGGEFAVGAGGDEFSDDLGAGAGQGGFSLIEQAVPAVQHGGEGRWRCAKR